MLEYQKRVIDENDELRARTEKLAEFLESDTFHGLSTQEQIYLHLQLRHITQHDLDVLADILRKQIESGEFARDVEERIRPYRDNLRRYDPFLILD